MDVEGFTENIFKIDPKILYVGIVDNEFRLLQSRIREGIRQITPEQTLRDFISMVPPVVMGGVGKLQPFLGQVSGLTIRYEKIVMALYPIAQYVVIVSFDPQVETPFMTKIGESIKKVMSQLL